MNISESIVYSGIANLIGTDAALTLKVEVCDLPSNVVDELERDFAEKQLVIKLTYFSELYSISKCEVMSGWSDSVYELLDLSISLMNFSDRNDTTEVISDFVSNSNYSNTTQWEQVESLCDWVFTMKSKNTPKFEGKRFVDILFHTNEEDLNQFTRLYLVTSPNAIRRFAEEVRRLHEEINIIIYSNSDDKIIPLKTSNESFIDYSDGLPAFITAVKTGDSDAYIKSISTIGELIEHAMPTLLRLIKSDDRDQRVLVIQALGKMKSTSAVSALIDALDDEYLEARLEAIYYLGEIGALESIEHLAKALKDPKKHIRQQAASALGKIKDVRAVPFLIESLEDADTDAIWRSATALGEIGSSTAVPALEKLLSHHIPEVRWRAFEAIVKIGAPSRFALKQATNDENKYVQLLAGQMIILKTGTS